MDVVVVFTVMESPLTVKFPVTVAFPSTVKSPLVASPISDNNFDFVAMILFILFRKTGKKKGT